MLKTLFRILNKDLTGRTCEVEAAHAYFGEMVLFAFKDSDKSCWEAEMECDGERLTVAIDAPDRTGPSEGQVDFARRLLSDLDAAFARAQPLLVPEYERWHNESFPTAWRVALNFVGFSVPTDGDERNAWELSYESLRDPGRHQLTCYFIDGQPHHVTIDG